MPYVITTKQPHDTRYGLGKPGVAWDSVTRRAVATLDEARHVVTLAIASHGQLVDHRSGGMDALLAAGGTIGPLPDGTVIEVGWAAKGWLWAALPREARETQITRHAVGRLRRATLGRVDSSSVPLAAVIDAYNAAQEA